MVSEQETNKKSLMGESQIYTLELLFKTISNLIDLYKANTNENQNSYQSKNFGVDTNHLLMTLSSRLPMLPIHQGCQCVDTKIPINLPNLQCSNSHEEIPKSSIQQHLVIKAANAATATKKSPNVARKERKEIYSDSNSDPDEEISDNVESGDATNFRFPTPKKTYATAAAEAELSAAAAPPVTDSSDDGGRRNTTRQPDPSLAEAASVAAEAEQQGRKKKRRRRKIWAKGKDRSTTADKGAVGRKTGGQFLVGNQKFEEDAAIKWETLGSFNPNQKLPNAPPSPSLFKNIPHSLLILQNGPQTPRHSQNIPHNSPTVQKY